MEIDVATVRDWIDSGFDHRGVPIYLLDCREGEEYRIAHIPDSHLVPLSSWPPEADIIEAMRGKQVVVYCHHGGRSLRAAHWLRQNGFPDSLSMAGGIDLWSQIVDPAIPRY